MAFTQITVTGRRQFPDGAAATGVITFTPTVPMRNSTSSAETSVRAPVYGQITAGVISASVAATTDPGTLPLNGSYSVEERYIGVSVIRRYHLRVPHDSPGGVLDLDTTDQILESLPGAVVYPVPGPTGPAGPTGPQGVQGVPGDGSVDSVNGDSGPAIVLGLGDLPDFDTSGAAVGQVVAVTGVGPLEASTIRASAPSAAAFGANPDGVTITTSALMAALTASAGATVYVPAGTYLTDTLAVPADTTLWLDDRATLKLTPGASRALVTLGARAILRGGRLDGNSANQTDVSGAGLLSSNGDDVTAERVVVVDANDYGIRLSHNRGKVRDCVLSGIVAGNAIFVQAGSASVVDNEVTGCHVDRSAQGVGVIEGGIKVHQNGAFTTERTRVLGNKVIMPASPTSDAAVCVEVHNGAHSATVQSNICTGGSMGISVAGADSVSVVGNVIVGSDLYGVELASTTGSTASANVIDGNGVLATGLEVNSGSDGCVLTGNSIVGCTGNNIVVEGGSSNIGVVGNMITATAGHGISCSGCSFVNVSGNTIDGSGTATKGVMLDATHPATFTGNLIRRFTENAAMIFGNTAITINNIVAAGNVFIDTNTQLAVQLSGGASLGANVKQYGMDWPYINEINTSSEIRQLADANAPGYFAGRGSIYHRTNGGPGATLYVKEGGDKNDGTGWSGVLTNSAVAVATAAAATTPGAVVRKVQVFDASGASLGFIALYDAIT